MLVYLVTSLKFPLHQSNRNTLLHMFAEHQRTHTATSSAFSFSHRFKRSATTCTTSCSCMLICIYPPITCTFSSKRQQTLLTALTGVPGAVVQSLPGTQCKSSLGGRRVLPLLALPYSSDMRNSSRAQGTCPTIQPQATTMTGSMSGVCSHTCGWKVAGEVRCRSE